MASFNRDSYGPYATARLNGGGAIRQARHNQPADPAGRSSLSPHRLHRSPLRTGSSAQQASQIGTEESRARGEAQRTQEAGKRMQLAASMGLRRTRTTARQRDISDGGTSCVSVEWSLWKTHLALAKGNRPRTIASSPLSISISAGLIQRQGREPVAEDERPTSVTGARSRAKQMKDR